MKRILILLGVVIASLVGYGALSLEPAEAGCGTGSGCGASHATQQQAPATAAEGNLYSCPMHPEVVSNKPGKCPKCGMNLEKVKSSADSQDKLTGDMAAQCQQMVDEFVALQDHFDMMMKLIDVEDLGPAMVEHQKMMIQFAADLTEHQNYCHLMTGAKYEETSSRSGHSNHGH